MCRSKEKKGKTIKYCVPELEHTYHLAAFACSLVMPPLVVHWRSYPPRITASLRQGCNSKVDYPPQVQANKTQEGFVCPTSFWGYPAAPLQAAIEKLHQCSKCEGIHAKPPIFSASHINNLCRLISRYSCHTSIKAECKCFGAYPRTSGRVIDTETFTAASHNSWVCCETHAVVCCYEPTVTEQDETKNSCTVSTSMDTSS